MKARHDEVRRRHSPVVHIKWCLHVGQPSTQLAESEMRANCLYQKMVRQRIFTISTPAKQSQHVRAA